MTTPAPRPQPAALAEGWLVEVPMPYTPRGLPVGWLTLNGGPADRRARARVAKAWRQAAYQQLQARRIPKGLGRVHVQVEIRTLTANKKDPGNWEPTIKPVIDALGPSRTYRSPRVKSGWVHEPGWEVIPDDDPAHLVRPEPIYGPPLGRGSHTRPNPTRGLIILHITPLPD